jgi:HK97 gp10 family phage protein
MVLANGHTFTIDEAAVQALATDPDGPVYRDLERRCLKAQQVATDLCPVDTGRLQASIDYVIVRDAKGLVGYVGSNVEYAIYVELGTWRTSAQPYLRPAAAAVGGDVSGLDARPGGGKFDPGVN